MWLFKTSRRKEFFRWKSKTSGTKNCTNKNNSFIRTSKLKLSNMKISQNGKSCNYFIVAVDYTITSKG